MTRSIAHMLTILLGAVLALILIPAPESHAAARSVPAPSTDMALPTCTHEDGSGQMLCTWPDDNSTQGDCSIPTVGTWLTSKLCVELYLKPATYERYNDGTIVTGPNGKALVEKCLTINFELSDSDKREMGWTILECIHANL